MDQDSNDCDLINRLFIWRRRDRLSCKSKEASEGSEFIKIPVTNPKGKIENIVALLIRSKKPLDGNPIVIIGHGNGETIDQYTQFSDTFLLNGVSVCIIDYRGYGYSDGEYGTASANEREDLIELYEYLKDKGFEKISYFGRSLGATCGIFLASEFPDLVCIALDSPWLSTKEWNKYMAKEFYHIDEDQFEKLMPIVLNEIQIETDINFDEIQEPRDVADKINQPIFLMHGQYDDVVPPENSDEFLDLIKSEEIRFELFDGDHNDERRKEIFYEMFKFILHHNGVDV